RARRHAPDPGHDLQGPTPRRGGGRVTGTTMRIGTIRPAAGATRPRKRRGKGSATGLGGTAGKGHKGKKARAGGKIPAWFEGGQMPLQRRLPKRGFQNPGRVAEHGAARGRLAPG